MSESYWSSGHVCGQGADEFDRTMMEWTKVCAGLSDKNEREIYEGDIIQLGGGSPSVVYWDAENCGYEPFIAEWLPVNAEVIEVIGNIYEKPELQTA